MQGDVRVKSKPGRGSDFIVAFPARVSKEVEALAAASNEGIPGADALQGKTYLLLDDVAENTFIMSESLKRYGIRSVERQNGMDALDTYKDKPAAFSGIITDLRMPLMSGQTFIQEVRKFERGANIPPVPIVVMSAEAAMEERRLCLTQYGANEYLLKPVKLRELVGALVRANSSGDQSAKSRGRKKRVLIVDDDVIGSRFTLATLERAGHRCTQAFSVNEGLKRICEESEVYNVVILDNLLGDGTGLDFVRRLRSGEEASSRSKAKVISISGNDVETQRRMYETEMGVIDGYLQKPVRKQELLGLIQIL